MNVTYKVLLNKLENRLITHDEITTQANIYLSINKFEDAYPYVKASALISKNSLTDKITAGLLAVSLEKQDDAKELFKLVIEQEPTHFDANYNLALLEIDEQNYTDAYHRLENLSSFHKNNSEIQNDLAVIATFQRDSDTAFKHWRKALEINPNDSTARNNALAYSLEKNFYHEADQLLSANMKSTQDNKKSIAEINRWQQILSEKKEILSTPKIETTISHLHGKKIAVFSSIDSFMIDIVSHLQVANEVKLFDNSNIAEMSRLMEWADISWFEWCDQLLIEATKLEKKSQIVCRLHSYEAFTDQPLQVDWQKVDLLIFVNKSVQELVSNKIPATVPQVVIHNAVNTMKFTLPQNKKYGKKIASVGYINYKKNPELLLYCFKKLYDYDNSYSLHIAGQHQDSRIQLYFQHFQKENNLPIHFDGWVEDMASWYADKDFVVSTSLFESFHYSIAEGMASGIMPLIHNWYGAKYIYPENFLFNTPDDFLEMMKAYEKKNLHQVALENRKFIVDNYSLDDKMNQISQRLTQLIPVEETVEV